jgi:hypothetical protein
MLDGGGLFFFVERHNDDRRAVALDQSRAPFELLSPSEVSSPPTPEPEFCFDNVELTPTITQSVCHDAEFKTGSSPPVEHPSVQLTSMILAPPRLAPERRRAPLQFSS